MKLLSFIIPSYNSERFLQKCIESLLNGGCSERIEIIVVNDGSKDSTEDIAKEYVERFPNTIKLVSQENRGHGGAINAGCKAVSGKYFKIIDADDWVLSENIKNFVDVLENIESDVVVTQYETFDISTNEVKSVLCSPPEFNRQYNLSQVVEDWANFENTVTFHGITYRTSFYNKYSNDLCEKVFYEDHEFSTFPCCFAKTIMPLDILIYSYRIGDVEQSVSDSNQLKRLSHYDVILDKHIHRYINDLKNADESAKAFVELKTKILLMSFLTILLLVEPNKKQGRVHCKKVVNQIKEHMPNVYKMVRFKIIVLNIMNRLHISKQTMNKLMASKVYRMIKGARS